MRLSEKVLFGAALIFLVLILVKHTYIGLTTLPHEGDSLYLHTPIAKAILEGTIFNTEMGHIIAYPASSELILAAFLALHIPLNLYNILALVLLFFALRILGITFGLSNNFSVIFAFTIVTLYGLLRYADTQKIDIWFLLFYVLCLNLLQKPKRTLKYFLLLGFTTGMVVGSKYSGPLYILVLAAFYCRDIYPYLNLKRILVYSIPFIVFGLVWYLRNMVNTGNPMYPQDFLFFEGRTDGGYYEWPYWKTLIQNTKGVLDALISEYMIWVMSFVLLPLVLLLNKLFGHFSRVPIAEKLILLAIANLVVFFLLPVPPANDYEAIVFGIRYSFPAIVTAVLCIFVLAKEYKEEVLLSCISLVNALLLLMPISYRPKLVFLYIPILVVGVFIVRHFSKKGKKIIK